MSMTQTKTENAPKNKGGRPRIAPEQKSKPREIWATDAQWTEITERAKTAGMRRASYITKVALKSRIVARPTPDHWKAWSDLARVSANLNQIVGHMNTGGSPASAQIEASLKDLRHQVEALRGEIIGQDVRDGGA